MNTFAIVPAAGRHRRMGHSKLDLPWRGETILDSVLRAWRDAGVSQTIVVVRAHDQLLAQRAASHGANVVSLHPDPPEMKDSVAAALDFVAATFRPAPNDAWLLAPADMPQLSSHVIAALVTAYLHTPYAIHVPVHEQKRGHPVVFPWPLAREVACLEANQGVNTILTRHPVIELPCGPEALALDCDTPAQYQRLREGND